MASKRSHVKGWMESRKARRAATAKAKALGAPMIEDATGYKASADKRLNLPKGEDYLKAEKRIFKKGKK